MYDQKVIPFDMPTPVASEGLHFAHIAFEICIRAAMSDDSGNFLFSTNVNLVPPNQFELSDCQEVIVNNTYIWDLPASPLVFGLFGPTGPLSVTDHMATQIKPEVPAVHVALVHFQLCSTLRAVETRRSLSISSHR